MECSKINLSAYLDNELSEKERLEIERHIEICRDCREEIETLSSLNNNLLNLKEEIEPSSNFNMKFWERVKAEDERKKIGLFWLPIPATAVLLLIILFHITSFSYALIKNRDPYVQNIVLQQVKETIFRPSISKISCLINLCEGCIHYICKSKGIECRCKQCKIHRR